MGWPEAHGHTPRCRDVDVLDALLHGDGAAGCAVVVDDGAVVVVVDGVVVEGSGWWEARCWDPETFGLVKRWAWRHVDACLPSASLRVAGTRWVRAGRSACWAGRLPALRQAPSLASCIWTFDFETRFSPEIENKKPLAICTNVFLAVTLIFLVVLVFFA